MRYRARTIIQAYSLAALRRVERVGSVDCAEREQLTREIVRYARGESGGRAVLVSGARGAGKTSLVYEAMQHALESLQGQGLRPVLVSLDAPSLFMPSSKESPDDTRDQIYKDMELVLRRAAVALFQAVEEETWRALLDRSRTGAVPLGLEREDLVELASRLRAELAQAPTLQELRDLWRRAGLLEGGGLFGRPDDEGHGLREVLALWSAVRAYHVASDTVVGESEQGSEQEQSRENKFTAKWNLREALNPILGLVSGVLVGLSVYDEGGLLAALLGTLTAVLTGAALDVSVRHFREEKRSLTYKVTLDTTPYALTRLLPALVTHLRETGIAPVFVVDNLDRVKDRRERLDALMGNLKSFVAEDAFFCFLADRDYFELLRLGPRGGGGGAAFSDRMLVCYGPEDLRRWLVRVLEPERPLTAPADIRERDLLVTGLMGRARMRLGELHRDLRALSGLDGALELPEGDVTRSPLWRVHAHYQAALERALTTPAVKHCTHDDNYALLLCLDALYWPRELWERGEPVAPSQERVRAAVEAHIELGALGAGAESPKLLSPHLLAVLSEAVDVLVEALADPAKLGESSPLAGLGLSPLLERVEGGGWRWTADVWGNAVQ